VLAARYAHRVGKLNPGAVLCHGACLYPAVWRCVLAVEESAGDGVGVKELAAGHPGMAAPVDQRGQQRTDWRAEQVYP
jgi:hypothetical protein